MVRVSHQSYASVVTEHHFFFVAIHTSRKRSQTGRGHKSWIRSIHNNIEIFDLKVDTKNAVQDEIHKTRNEDHKQSVRDSVPTICTLQISSKTATNHVLEEHPSRKGKESFRSRSKLIAEQINRLWIDQEHSTSVLYALLNVEAQKACKNLKLNLLTLKEMILEAIKKVLFGKIIKDRRVTR